MRWMIPCLLLTSLAAMMRAEDWTQFRGPGNLGVSPEKNLPTKWSADEGLRWKAALPGRGLSSPVIVDGQVFVTACSGPTQERLHVLSFDAKTGKKLWERQLWATGNTNCHPMTNMAAPTPVADKKAFYALFATADLAAFDRAGNLLWYRSLVEDYPTITNQVGMASSPILYKDMLIVPMDNAGESFIAAIDTKTGKNRWRIDRNREINWTTPVLRTQGSTAELLIASREGLTSFDVESGKKRWSTAVAGSAIPTPVLEKDRILVPSGELVCLLPVEGQTEPVVVWKSNKLRTGFASPLYYQDRVYTVTGAGVLVCADTKDGNVLWQERLKGKYHASPIAADGLLYLVNENGLTTVIKTGDKPEIIARNEVKEDILATPAVADGAIYLRSDKHLFCVGSK